MTDHGTGGDGEPAPTTKTTEESATNTDSAATNTDSAATNTDSAADVATPATAGTVLPAGSRRHFMKAAAAGTFATVLGATAMTGQSAAVTTSQITPSDGFADVGAWLENENPQVITVTEATRSAVESAFHASGPRVVVFETSGTIDLGGETLTIPNDKCWVAGQTAPSPGITFVKGLVQVDANDCVVQHVRSRVGPGPNGDIQGNDSFNTQDDTANNVLDHVTASWGVDECLSVGYDTDRTTVSNCLVYEGLHDPYGDGEDHNYGSLIGDNATDVALLGNVWAKARGRMPRLKGGTRSVVANNLTYFFDEAANCDDSTVTSFVGNGYLGALDTEDGVLENGQAYIEDNFAVEPVLESGELFSTASELASRPLWPSGFTAMAADQVEGHNLDNAGARPADRTDNDARIVQEIRDRAGNDRLDSPYQYWVGHHSEVGGYPYLPENTHSLSPPANGLRDWLADWAAEVETGSGGTTGTSGTSGTSGTTTGGTSGGTTSGGTSGSSGGLWGSGGSDDGGSSGGLWGSGGSDDGGSSGGLWGSGGSDSGGSSGGLWGSGGSDGGDGGSDSGGWW